MTPAQLKIMTQTELSKKRDKGKAPSSEHDSHFPQKKKQKVTPVIPDDPFKDPTYVPDEDPPNRGRGRGRGRGSRGGRGKGRGKGASNFSTSSGTDKELDQSTKGQHWRDNELSALLKGANHLKSILRGRFKHATDGVRIKTLAWNELRGRQSIYLHLILKNNNYIIGFS